MTNKAVTIATDTPKSAFATGLETLHPVYFSLVMATGIVSIAANLQELPLIARPLFWLNVFQYIVLWALFAARIIRFPRKVWADVTHHLRGPGFFTVVAGTGVLGVQCIVIANRNDAAAVLLGLTYVLWALITYGVLGALITKEEKPTLAEGLNGGWLVAVVATQSCAVLGSVYMLNSSNIPSALVIATTAMWCVGAIFYVWIIGLIFYRYMFFRFLPSDLSPPYWINMGALAISTLAGANIIALANRSAFLLSIDPFLRGATFLMWANATWWIPMLLLLGVWRHGIKRYPIRYDPMFWGMVFPLGMYSVCTYRLAESVSLPELLWISTVFLLAALAAWSVTFLGMLYTMIRVMIPRGT